MRVHFHQAVCLRKDDHSKPSDFSRGVHDVPAEYLETRHFHDLIKAGLVSDGEAQPSSPESLIERQKRLVDRILARPSKESQSSHGLSSTPAPAGEAAEVPSSEPSASLAVEDEASGEIENDLDQDESIDNEGDSEGLAVDLDDSAEFEEPAKKGKSRKEKKQKAR